jgi:hypothetical protein
MQCKAPSLPTLLFGGGRFCGCVGVFLGETLYAACGVYQFLLAGEERVAIWANFDAQHIAFDCGARGESVPAGAMHSNSVIVRVNTGLHRISILSRPVCAASSIHRPGSGVARSQATPHYTVSRTIRQIGEITLKQSSNQLLGISTATSFE